MRPLTVQQLLDAWEAGCGRPRTDRALALLAAACPESSQDDLAALSIGRRDDLLLTLREWTLGPRLTSLAECPGCRETLELDFTVADVRVSMPAVDEGACEESLTVKAHDYEVTFRLPNSDDLAGLEGVEDGRRHLLRNCVVKAERRGERRSFSRLPARVLDAVVERMSEVDPQADVYTELECPSCAHNWQTTFDIVSFFWEELESLVHRTLREVHTLALAYGWREADVFGLSPWRRQYYLQLASP